MERRDELVTARVTAVERRRIELAAQKRGESRSSFVREAADRIAREELTELINDRQERAE